MGTPEDIERTDDVLDEQHVVRDALSDKVDGDAAAAQLASDAALAAAMAFDDEPAFVACQICMDVLLVDEAVAQLCGDTCVAQVCSECLVQHITASVYSFYPGVLPKVRCPICLNLLSKSAWSHFVKPEPVAPVAAPGTANESTNTTSTSPDTAAEATETPDTNAQQQQQQQQQDVPAPAAPAAAPPQRFDYSHVLEKYEILCHQSCEFQSPCCHNTEYTMLPPFQADSEAALIAQLASPGDEATAQLLELIRAFCAHKQDTKTLYARVTDTCAAAGVAVDDALAHILAMMPDEERRATLLLHHLFLFPDTHTRCCNEVVCFKCKANVHHNGACDDFVEDDCVLQCRGCHVTLVKVDGCDSVSCICGHSIHWPSEMAKQRRQRKQLAPADDAEHALWTVWHTRVQRSFGKIHALHATVRAMRLARFVREHRNALRRVLVRYRRAMDEAKRKQEQQPGVAADNGDDNADSDTAAAKTAATIAHESLALEQPKSAGHVSDALVLDMPAAA